MSVGRPWVPLGRSSLAWLELEAHEKKWELRVAGEARLSGGGWGPAWRGGSQAAPSMTLLSQRGVQPPSGASFAPGWGVGCLAADSERGYADREA